ncbi:MAG TPA: AAA family ATPase [Gemmatimonadaceae bacterium]|nr:AAA family ATPase [Gemmatimonadaceae bacterium]
MADAGDMYAHPRGTLRLLTLGVPRLVLHPHDTHDPEVLLTGKPVALLTYLQFAPRRTVSAERLADLLWSNRSADAGLKNLRQTIWMVKQQLGDAVIERVREGVSLPLPFPSDYAEFETHVHAGALDEALAVYADDFFSGFASPGAAGFEEWADLERARARRLFIDAAELVAQREMNAGRPQRAVELARRVRSADPNGDTGWRLLLEALVSAGDTATARAEVDQFTAWRAANGHDDDPRSDALVRAVRRAARRAPDPSDNSEVAPDLIGRDREFAAICALWNDAADRGARRVHVVAEAGLGKTRLLTDVAARLAALRARVLVHRANVGERHLPFATVAALAARLAALPGARGISTASAAALVALNPALSSAFDNPPDPSTGDEALRRRGLALLELLGAVADEAPLALLIDDLHWCDDASAGVLGFLAGSLRDEQVLFVTTARPHRNPIALPDDTLRLALAPLDTAHVHALVASMGELPAESWARELPERLARCTGGSPLMVLEALRLCREHGALDLCERVWTCGDPGVLAELLQVGGVIRHRLAGLEPVQARLLVLIALAGLPLPRGMLAAAAGLADIDADAALSALEQRGLVEVAGDDLAVAHDEIGHAALAGADPDAERQAHAALGAAMAAGGAGWQQRAVGHLLAAGDDARAYAIVRHELGAAPHAGGANARILTLLGEHSTPERVARIRAELPFRVRHPRAVRVTIIAGAALAVLGSGGALTAWLRHSPPPDATLIASVPDARGEMIANEVPVRAADMDLREPIVIPRARSGTEWRYIIDANDIRRPGTREWAGQRPDSTGTHVEIRGQDGDHLRLPSSRGDDLPLAFSPDGMRLLIVTGRWHSGGDRDMAIVNMRTRAVRRLTSTANDESVGNAAWSPDGSRIAFTRLPTETGNSDLCLITVDGARQQCLQVGQPHLQLVLGWLDDHRVLLLLRTSETTAQCETFDVDTHAEKLLPIPNLTGASLDPTGKFILATQAGSGNRPVMSIITVDHYDRVRNLAFADSAARPQVTWGLATSGGRYIARLAIRHPAAPLQPRVPYLLKVRAWANDGTPTQLTTLQWRSLTPAVAGVDTAGVLVATDTGVAVIEASAGGWRTTVDSIHIARVPPRLALDERWTGNVTSRWRFFGQPYPAIVPEPSGIYAFLNNGDGTFFSGAYYRPTFDARRGLAVDADLSVPVTSTKWQLIELLLTPHRDSARLARWDHRTGYNPGLMGPGCDFSYPVREGPTAALSAALVGDWATATGDPTLHVGDGQWFHIRLQLFPDGRCGIALNGKPLFIGWGQAVADSTVSIMLQGNSVGTRVLVGRLRVVEGIPDDMDWTKLAAANGVWRATPIPHWPRWPAPTPASIAKR